MALEFADSGIQKMASAACELNERMDNIGARRLRAVISRIVEDISFDAPEMREQTVVVDEEFVQQQLEDVMKDEDLSKYIL